MIGRRTHLSRLDSFIERVSAQRLCLDMACGLVVDRAGLVLEIGLGNGRTYDHLRQRLPRHDILTFDRAIVAHPAFAAGGMHTGFLDDHIAELARPGCPPTRILSAALAASRRRAVGGGAAGKAAPDPWAQVGGWRLGVS